MLAFIRGGVFARSNLGLPAETVRVGVVELLHDAGHGGGHFRGVRVPSLDNLSEQTKQSTEKANHQETYFGPFRLEKRYYGNTWSKEFELGILKIFSEPYADSRENATLNGFIFPIY